MDWNMLCWEGEWIHLDKFDHDLTLRRNSGIMVSKGNCEDKALFQVGELSYFSRFMLLATCFAGIYITI
jgi:hypothetical protein